MIDKRIQKGIQEYLVQDYILPERNSYLLEELEKEGRTKLEVKVEGDNLCISNYDKKEKCNFLKDGKPLCLKKSVDHVILQKKQDKWYINMVEMKSQVNDNKWFEIKCKVRASYFNICALEKVLGIEIAGVTVYTTFETVRFDKIKETTNPKVYIPALGEKMQPLPQEEWENHQITVDIGELKTFQHYSVHVSKNSAEILEGQLILA